VALKLRKKCCLAHVVALQEIWRQALPFPTLNNAAEERNQHILNYRCFAWVHAVTQLVEALRYKPEGRGFDPRWC
jgi:hypothetical protein